MKQRLKLILFCLMLNSIAHAVECSGMHEAYQRLNRQIVVLTADDAERVTADLIQRTRPRLEQIMEGDIRSMLLGVPLPPPSQIRDKIACIAGRYRAEEENPALPYVIPINGDHRLLISYVIDAGGEGIPDSIPVVGLWSKQSDGLHVSHLDMSFFRRSSFTVTPIASKKGMPVNFLLSGKEYGDNESRLKLLLVHISENNIKATWRTFDYSAGSVSVNGNKVHIRFIANRKTGTYEELEYAVEPEGTPVLQATGIRN